MNLPGWYWHPLKSDLTGYWAVSVNGNWRLTFSFEGKDAILLRKDGGISVTEFAKHLKVSRVALSRVVNEHAGISPQLAHDLWKAQRKAVPKIQRLAA